MDEEKSLNDEFLEMDIKLEEFREKMRTDEKFAKEMEKLKKDLFGG